MGFNSGDILYNERKELELDKVKIIEGYSQIILNFDVSNFLHNIPSFVTRRKVLRSTKEYSFIIDSYYRSKTKPLSYYLSYRDIDSSLLQQEIEQISNHNDIPYFYEEVSSDDIKINLNLSLEKAKENFYLNTDLIKKSINSQYYGKEQVAEILDGSYYSL